jgi:hypothetical protein
MIRRQNVARVNRVQFGDDPCMISRGCAVLREPSLEGTWIESYIGPSWLRISMSSRAIYSER